MSVSAVATVKSPSLWKSKPFTILLSSVFLLTVGNKIYEIVLPLIMYEITHSSVSVTSMRTAELLPNFFFAIFIGVIVDRVNKKKWVLWMIGAQAALLFMLAYLFHGNIQTLSIYYMLGFLLMTFNYGFFNAQVSLTKLSVPTSQLTSANSKFSFVETFVGVMGPAISSLILLLPTFTSGILVTAVCYLVCLLFLSQLAVKEEHVNRSWNFKRDLYEAWAAFKSNAVLRTITVYVMFLNCSMTVVSTSVIVFAIEDLKLSSSILALVLSASGIGGLIGSLFASNLREKLGLGKLFGLAALLGGIAYLLLFYTANLYVLTAALCLIGFAVSFHTISVYTFRQEQTPAHLMGRIAGITGTLFRTGMPITMYLSGWMSVWWGTSSVFIAAAAWNLVLFGLYVRTKTWRTR